MSTNRNRKLVVPTIWALSLVVAASGTAFAATKLTGADIAKNAITSAHIKNGTINAGDINVKTRQALVKEAVTKAGKNTTPGAANAPGAAGAAGAAGAKGDAGATGAQGAQGAAGANGVAASLGGSFTKTNVAIAKISGPFADNATVAGTFELSAGTHVINGSALFHRAVRPGTATPQLQLAIRGPKPAGEQWGPDFGTGFTGAFPLASQDREISTSTTKLVTVNAPTTVTVYVYGYNPAGEATGSGGEFVAKTIDVTALRVG